MPGSGTVHVRSSGGFAHQRHFPAAWTGAFPEHAAHESTAMEEWGLCPAHHCWEKHATHSCWGVKPTALHKGCLPSSAGEHPCASAWSSSELGNCTTVSENPSAGFLTHHSRRPVCLICETSCDAPGSYPVTRCVSVTSTS